jgi:hypothetical protein
MMSELAAARRLQRLVRQQAPRHYGRGPTRVGRRLQRDPAKARIERLSIKGEQEQVTHPEPSRFIRRAICERRADPPASITGHDEDRGQPRREVTMRFDVALDEAAQTYMTASSLIATNPVEPRFEARVSRNARHQRRAFNFIFQRAAVLRSRCMPLLDAASLLLQPKESHCVVIEDIPLLFFRQEAGRLDSFDRHSNRFRPDHLVRSNIRRFPSPERTKMRKYS